MRLGATLLCAGVVALSLRLAKGQILGFLAARQLNQAQRLLAGRQPEEASAALREALRWRPGWGEARRQLGELELERGRLAQAFLEFQSLTELEPENADGWLGLAQVRVKAAQPAEAEAAISHVLELAPNRVGARTLRSELRYELGRYRGAYLDAEKAVHSAATDARAWVALARATARVKGHAAGLEAAEQGVAAAGLDPALLQELSVLRGTTAADDAREARPRESSADRAEKWPGALGALMRDIVVKIQQKDWNAAEELAASARRAYPATSMGPWLEGVIDISRGRLPSAEKSLLQALAVSPRSHRAVTNLVAVWAKQRGPLYAGDRLVALAKEDPGFDYPLPIAARAYLEADQPARAEATARLAFDALPHAAIPYRELAELYLELDRGSDALVTCEQGLALFPDDAGLQLQEARASLQLGDRERAIRTYERLLSRHDDDQVAAGGLATLLLETRTDAASQQRALEMVQELELDAPVDPEVLGAMGRVYLKVGKEPQRAQGYLEAAVRGAPDDASLHFHLAVARKMNGSAEQAAGELRAALRSGRPFPEEAEARRMLRELGGGG